MTRHVVVLTVPIKEVFNVDQSSLVLRRIIEVGIHPHHKPRSAPPGGTNRKALSILKKVGYCDSDENARPSDLELTA